ncbi:M23 family metallopeptidase [Phenylobacterium sp.]|uniref:M23 family metallopeptidase n=1 Tax=Phenylobacterium sp. TaxID=1871053 RepID=UPI002C15CF8D|nr:M23 family metallopeptidase [Phenylobacterium sp.]HVI32374.1 M23 family metallopeptidase [Phenylobacterium sp.]
MRLAPLLLFTALAACSRPAESQGAAAPAAAQPAPAQPPLAAAAGPRLVFPLACPEGMACQVQNHVDHDPTAGLKDYRCGRRTYDGHDGVDIRIPDMAAQARGVDVLAAAAGRVARLRDGTPDISIRTAGAPPVAGRECGNGVAIDHGDGWETQYCHLANGSIRVKAGDVVAAGQPIARVGLSGATEFAHLHLGVRHAGRMLDPFAPEPTSGAACQPQSTMWTPEAAQRLAYRAGTVLNAGFAPGPVTMEAVEAGGVAPPTADAPWLVPYVRAISLEGGDQIELTLQAPDGQVLAKDTQGPLDRDKAQYLMFIGKKRPAQGWPAGAYAARVRILRGGQVVAEQTYSVRL